MKNTIFLFTSLLLLSSLSYGQTVSLATTTLNPSKGTVVYNNLANYLQYWNGTAWIPLTNAASGTGWLLNGTNIHNNNTGNIGIGVANPVNRLQIGGIPANGFAGKDFAIGSILASSAISHEGNGFTITSTNNILLKPRNGIGYVGINTNTPRGPLDVTGSSPLDYTSYAYFTKGSNQQALMYHVIAGFADVSIYAHESVLSPMFVAISDARIKDVIGVSNSAKDLATIKAIKITDYNMKDKAQYGDKVFKKVIAQQVEEVYPEAVSKVTDVVPDIYELAENAVFDDTNKTLKCTMAKDYAIKVGEKVQFIHPSAGKIKAEVSEVAGNVFTVKDWQYATDEVFVFGREVNDFRAVDYEAISMLGVSAIQQLAKENEELKSKNTEINKKFELLSARLEAIEAQLLKPTGK